MDTSGKPSLRWLEGDRPKKAGLLKVRFTIALLATLCPVVCYISRQNLPFAIVSMVEDPALQHRQHGRRTAGNQSIAAPNSTLIFTVNSQRQDSAWASNHSNDHSNPPDGACSKPIQLGDQDQFAAQGYGPKYAWSATDKGYLLGAFFYTYVLCQIPGARLAERIGAKWILVVATLGSALLSLASPWAASVHVHLLSLVRLLMGACQAALYPTCYVLYARWLPPIERSQALPILCVGAYVGSIVASSLTGYFSEQAHLGWQYAFYMPGLLCALWTCAWIWLAANEPRDHPSISIEELVYIESKLELQRNGGSGGGGGNNNENNDNDNSDSPAGARGAQISWRKLFASRSIWAMMVAFFASNWSFTIVLLLIPTYLNRILHVSPLSNGIINSIIYVLYCIASPLVGSGSTLMVETRAFGLSRLNLRKLFQGTALFGQSICFVALPLFGCDQRYVLGALFLQIVLFSFVNGGEVQLPTELSVDFAGTIYAIGNCVGSSTGFIVPLVFSAMVRNEDSRDEWALYFYVSAAISALGGLIFIAFGGNHLQDFSRDLGESQLNICKLTGVLHKAESGQLDSKQGGGGGARDRT